jgi:hypothetical protein
MFARRFFGNAYYGPRYWGNGAVEQVEVPDVVGDLQADGTTELQGAGFVVAVANEYSSVVPVGTIISQSPAGGEFALPGSTVTIAVSLGARADGAGKPRKHRHRYFVQIDGQDFEVRDQQEAIEVLQKAAALAEVAAERQAKSAKPQQTPKVEPVKLAPPVIRTNAPVDLEPYREAIERAYRNAAMAEEMRRLLEAQMWDDEEAAVYLLLH